MKSNKNKIIYILAAIIFIPLIGFAIFSTIKNYRYHQDLLKNGIRTEVQIVGADKLTTRKGKTIRYYLDIAIFPESKSQPKKETVKTKPKNGSDLVDNLFDDIGVKTAPTGDYQKIRLTVAAHNWGALHVGDWTTFVYLPNEVDSGKLLVEIE